MRIRQRSNVRSVLVILSGWLAAIILLFLCPLLVESFRLAPTRLLSSSWRGRISYPWHPDKPGYPSRTVSESPRSHATQATRLFGTTSALVSETEKRHVVVIGAGWGGLAVAHSLVRSAAETIRVTVVESAPRVGGLVRDGFSSINGTIPNAEAGQHGFWDQYHNIFRLLRDEIPGLDIDQALTGYAEQGQYSPQGQEAVWPVYREQSASSFLPTGLAQAALTRFLNLPWLDRLSAFPLALALVEYDGQNNHDDWWRRFDELSFRDLCVKLGVTRRCYDEVLEPMILTGLFAPGNQCSAAAALGMAYFFVLQTPTAFDVRWCRGNIGEVIFDPWVRSLEEQGVHFLLSTRVTGLGENADDPRQLQQVHCRTNDGQTLEIDDADEVVLAVGAVALNQFVRYCPILAQYDEFRRFANLRGTSVLATRLYLDRDISIPYSANACWGFDRGVGMTVFDIGTLHGTELGDGNRTIFEVEVDYYHASSLLVLSDDELVEKVKKDLDTLFPDCRGAAVLDAAIVRLPSGVNWYYPGSYQDRPDIQSGSLSNLYFVGDLVRSQHGSWSQEKAFVSGLQAANLIMGRPMDQGVLPLGSDELHVQTARNLVSWTRTAIGGGVESRAPSLADFLW